jgi:hypothetical protein
MLSPQPTLHLQPAHALELGGIRRDHDRANGARMRRDQEIVAADRRAGGFQRGADGAEGA